MGAAHDTHDTHEAAFHSTTSSDNGNRRCSAPKSSSRSLVARRMHDVVALALAVSFSPDRCQGIVIAVMPLSGMFQGALGSCTCNSPLHPHWMQVFDYLRASNSPSLTHLLDIYTFTTAISVCSASQNLRRALDLMADMRARGIACNVHTYSALMNVAIKSNEVRSAQASCSPGVPLCSFSEARQRWLVAMAKAVRGGWCCSSAASALHHCQFKERSGDCHQILARMRVVQ